MATWHGICTSDICELGRETKQEKKRKRNNKECISFFVYRCYPPLFINTIERVLLYCNYCNYYYYHSTIHTRSHSKTLQYQKQTPAIARPPCYNETLGPFVFRFLLEALVSFSRLFQSIFCHPGLRHMWAGLPIRQTTRPNRNQPIHLIRPAGPFSYSCSSPLLSYSSIAYSTIVLHTYRTIGLIVVTVLPCTVLEIAEIDASNPSAPVSWPCNARCRDPVSTQRSIQRHAGGKDRQDRQGVERLQPSLLRLLLFLTNILLISSHLMPK